jgi:hypothetical protein
MQNFLDLIPVLRLYQKKPTEMHIDILRGKRAWYAHPILKCFQKKKKKPRGGWENVKNYIPNIVKVVQCMLGIFYHIFQHPCYNSVTCPNNVYHTIPLQSSPFQDCEFYTLHLIIMLPLVGLPIHPRLSGLTCFQHSKSCILGNHSVPSKQGC